MTPDDEHREVFPNARLSLCRQVDPELFFPEQGGRTEPARRVCQACPVSFECLEYALKVPSMGIWGGTSETDRRHIMRERGLSYWPIKDVA